LVGHFVIRAFCDRAFCDSDVKAISQFSWCNAEKILQCNVQCKFFFAMQCAMQCSYEKFFAMLAMFAMQLIALLSALTKISHQFIKTRLD
jgi:hypothetical protein